MNSSSFVFMTPEGKGILGELDGDGVLTFAVDAGPDSTVRGTALFDRMLEHFGERVRVIHGVWRKGIQDRASTNIDKVNELTAQGIALETAVLSAWTVTRAKRWGFDQVYVTGLTEGTAGAYTKIDVLIERSR